MKEREEHRVYLGLGSNLGDRRENLLSALRKLDSIPGVKVLRVSSIYESEPWGLADQPDFLNLVALVATSLTPPEMLEACLEVERALGRVRGVRWGPRVIDVDILLYDDIVWECEDLVIPHPRMGERDFVLVPLRELDPGRAPLPREAEREAMGLRRVGSFEEGEWHA
ncbi:MAG: 2-amino-4-hydroxy-6-hydroxymethyldihydropteridine diphosphokinase [Actinomycetota bacterium]